MGTRSMRLLDDRAAQRALTARLRSNASRALSALRAGGAGRVRGKVLGLQQGPVELRVHGWVRQGQGASVVVDVDGVPLGVTRPSPDVVVPGRDEELRLHPDAWGWELRCRHDELPEGEITLGARVVRPDGLVDDLGSVTAQTRAERQLGTLDAPQRGATVPAVFDVLGWIRTDAAIDAIEIDVDGGQVVNARLYSAPRPDIAGLREDDPWSPLAGWHATVVLPPDDGDRWHADSPTSARTVTLTTWAVARGRRHLLDTRDVEYVPIDRATKDEARALAVRGSALPVERVARRGHAGVPRVLVANHHLGLGGGQLYLFELLRQMAALGPIDVTVLTEVDGALRGRLEDMGIRVRTVGAAPPTAVRYEEWADTLTAYAAQFRPDVVLANTAGCFWGVDLAHRLGLPSIWSVHESFDPELFLRHYYGETVDEWTRGVFYASFARASAVVFEADATRDIFRHLADPRRMIRIDYGVDLAEIDAFVAEHPRAQVRARLGLKPDDIAFVCIGTYEPRKAQGLLTSAFLEIADQFPQARLVLVGDSPNPYSAALHQVLAEVPGSSQVRTVGVTGAVYDWYHAADAFVLASDVESLSRAMLEAMAFGAVPVVSDVFGTSSVVQDGRNGMLFDPTSVASVRQALTRYASADAAERAAMAEQARATVDPARDSKHYGLEYRMLVDELVADPETVDFARLQEEVRALREGRRPGTGDDDSSTAGEPEPEPADVAGGQDR
ncbi:hypothetical protein ATM99_04880 [Cellulomonas sp. B6]|nr:hypothetical protein ATM99_04880 [Cellulomonas sp. B6]